MRRSLSAFAVCLLAVLPASASISGYLMTSAGQPIAGARIDEFAFESHAAIRERLLTANPEPAPIATAQSDTKGHYTLESPAAPVVVLRITAQGYAPIALRVERDEDIGAKILSAAEAKTGRITAAGKPVAGARIVFSDGEMIATTDAEGRYTVPDPAKWAGSMSIIHPDFAIDDLNGFRMNSLLGGGRGRRAAAAAPLDATLSGGVAVTGKVVGEDGQTPVGGAMVSVAGWPLTTSAQDGTFTIRHAPSNWDTVVAKSGDLVGVRSKSTNASALVVKLGKASTFSGSIRDSKTKTPLAGAEVRLFQPMRLGGPTNAMLTSITDAKGNFAITGIEPGTYQMMVVRPGYDLPAVSLSFKPGEKVTKSYVAMPLARVSGIVTDEQKRPIAAVRINPQGVQGGAPFAAMMPRSGTPAVSAPDGTFLVTAEPDTDLQLVATRIGYPNAKTPTLHLAPAERKSGVVLTMPNGIAVSGRVIDKNGKPIAGVEVSPAESENGFGGNMVRRIVNARGLRASDEDVKSAADGSFTVKLKEGTYDILLKRSGYASKLVRAVHVTATPQPIEATLQPAVEITGRVTRGGTGVEGVHVMVFGEGTQETADTGADGSFIVSDLSPGQVMLNATKPEEFIQIMRPVTAPATDVNLEAPAGSRVSGRVVDKDTSQPITSFDLGVSAARGGGGMMFLFPGAMRHVTSDDGTFVLDNVPAGQDAIVVNAPGYTTARVPNVNVEAGKPVTDVEVAMDHGVRVVGHVSGSDGSPLAGASVRVGTNSRTFVPPGPMQGSTTVTDANGDYAIEAVESGDKTVFFSYSGLQPQQKSATLSGTETRVDAQMSSGMAASGSVVTDSGVPVPDADVNASSAAQSGFGFQSTKTDANGNFSFNGLTPGHYTFRASKAGYTTGSVSDFDIATGPVRISLSTGGEIFGHVSGLSPDELQTATVQASGPKGGASAAVDGGGNYRIEGAPTDTVRVLARTTNGLTGGRTSPVQSVQVSPGTPVQVDITFNSSTVITGHVTRNGSPVDGAIVAFTPQAAQAQTTARTTTSNGGQYQVTGLDDASYNVSVVDIQRSAPFSTTYQVHGSGSFDIDMKTASLRGHVVDTNGTAVADALVEIHEKADTTGARMLNQTVQTDASGTFALQNVPPGAYTITASKDGYGTKSVDTTVTDSGGAVDIALTQNEGVTLRVVDARNGQVLQARVHVTDANGAAVYDSPFMGGSADSIKLPLDPGTYKAQIGAMNYAPQTVTITSPSSPTIGLTPGGTIAVQSKGTGLRRARLLGADGTPYVGHSYFTVDPAPGVTILNNIAPGTYTLQILGEKNEVTATAPVTVAGDGQTTTVPI